MYDPVYRAWKNMMDRCYNKNHKFYALYGGRGILVDKTWHMFENFKKDMGLRPTKYTLERINNEDSYSKENCTWATQKQQIRNRRSTLKYTVNDIEKTLFEWSEDKMCNVSYNTLHHRIKLGWDIETAISQPKRKYNRKLVL